MIKIVHKVKATELDYRGYGITKDLGKVGFIKGLLPGEEAMIKITFEKRNFFEGEVVELLTKSNYRSNYQDDFDNNSLIHLDNLKQLEFQVNITVGTLLRNGISNFKTNDIITDHNYYNYRNKALFFVRNNPYIELGGFREKTRIFNKIDNLILAEPIINEILKTLQEYYETNKIYYHDLHAVMLRSNLKEVMVTFITRNKKIIPDILYEPLMDNQRVVSIYQNYQDQKHRNLGVENIIYRKNKFITDKIGKYKFLIYPNSFFQVNRGVTKLTYDYIKSLLDKDDIVIDAFAGMSSIGQYISNNVSSVYSIEIDKESVKSAQESIQLNNVANVEVIRGNFNKEFSKYHKRANTIIIDPPRSGLMEEVTNLINNSKLEKVIYLSCNLRTLVRDLKLFTNYEVVSVTPIKMFFQTVEMETLIYLRRKQDEK